jgi:hypothetical protein
LEDTTIEEKSRVFVEMALFIGAGIVYLGLLAWIFKTKIRSKVPYIVVAVVSVVLIVTYVASTTIGVPMVGAEYYVGRLDIVIKFFK